MADGCARFSHLGRTLRDRADRERRLNSPFGGMPGQLWRPGRPHDSQGSAADNAAAGCGVSRSPATAIAPAGAEIGRASGRETVCEYVLITVVAVTVKNI